MELCRTIAIIPDDLMSEDSRKAFQKLKQIQNFDAQNHVNGLKTSEDQIKVVSKEKDNNYREVANLKEQIAQATNEICELEREKEGLIKTLDEKDSRLDTLEKAVKQNRINQEKELEKFNESRAKNIQKLNDEIEAEHSIKENIEITEITEGNKRIHQDIETLKTKNVGMKNELELLDTNYCQSYIGKVCLNLQANMYQFVMPDLFQEDLTYKIKDLEEDIEDEYLLSDEEREQALERWEDLKTRLRWNPSLEKTLKMLQKEGNPMCQPNLTVEEAERVVDELNKQGRLRGRTSFEKVQKIIEMWKTSITLVQSLAV